MSEILKECSHPGCHTLLPREQRKCALHTRQDDQDYASRRKGDVTQRLYPSSSWRRVRAQHLASEPLCRTCRAEGRITRANTVDHFIPVRAGGAMYDDGNLRSLCAPCHSRMHAQDGTRWGNAPRGTSNPRGKAIADSGAQVRAHDRETNEEGL